MNILSFFILAMALVATIARVIGGPRGVVSDEDNKERHLQFFPFEDEMLYTVSKGEKSKGGKGKGGKGKGKKCGGEKFGYPDSCNSIKKIPKKINKSNTVAKRAQSEHWRFYCEVFEHFYATSHCVNDRCSDVPPVGPFPFPIDLQFGNPFFDEMEKGICLLLQFHDDICPADPSLACQCDSAYEWNPSTGRCDRYEGSSAGEDLALVGYCEKLTGGNWDDSLSGTADVSNECLRGCTRYIAAEGHACCPHTCDCTAQYRQCPAESCAYCRACCDSCEGCDAQGDYPNICREKKPCEPIRYPIRRCDCMGKPDCACDRKVVPTMCPCRGTPNCPCDDMVVECPCLGEPECECDIIEVICQCIGQPGCVCDPQVCPCLGLPNCPCDGPVLECPCLGLPNCPCGPVLPCPCVGQPGCFCDNPCDVVIIPVRGEEEEEEVVEEPLKIDGESEDDVPDVFKSKDGNEMVNGGEEPEPISSTVASVAAGGEENISNDDGDDNTTTTTAP